ncbi:MAG: DUF177 domain-containing protein [Alphaproteobacteria bacterium]|nr:DUF177 domain-containing protein [Alphaproteobacteria bacterium]
MTPTPTPARIEFSRPVSTEGLAEEGAAFAIEADASERAALARRFDLKCLDRLQATLRLTPDQKGLLRLDGRLLADVVQVCVVTLADVAAAIDAPFALRFSSEVPGEADQGAVYITIDEEDPPEPLIGKTLDLGEVVAEQLALALDPYPRVPGAVFRQAPPEAPGEDAVNSPFRKLVTLKSGK